MKEFIVWQEFFNVICLVFKYDLNSRKMNAVMLKSCIRAVDLVKMCSSNFTGPE